jgi:serine/threonine protein kinase
MIDAVGKAVDQLTEATRLGSYEIVRKLARGGMAELYLARAVGPQGFEKVVVLKKILPNFAENPKFVKLFLDEAKIAAALDHPHIAQVYDMGMVDGNYFFTMEYVHGQDVRAVLRRTARMQRQFPIEHAVQITRNVAAALHYAHERRRPDGSLLDIVHRDVSPSNVLISFDGAVKLVDFGVAKAATSSVKTRTGTLKGKIAYMSPEQAKGAGIDRRSDIFSLGILLWEMITTTRLFKAENDLATIQQIINSTPTPPSQLRPECSPELEQVALKALAADPDRRYATAEELQLDLEELAREQKLSQSSIALRSHMHVLFAAEIEAWKNAQASGITLTDHVVSSSVVDMTTPISVSEMSYEDENDDESEGADPDLPTASQQGSIASNAATRATSNDDATSRVPRAEVVDRPSARVPVRVPTHTPSGPVAMPASYQGSIAGSIPGSSPGSHPGSYPGSHPARTPTYPVVPLGFQRSSDRVSSPGDDRLRRRNKLIVIGVGATLGFIVMIALIFGGDGKQPTPPAADTPPTPVERAPAPASTPTDPVEPTPAPVETKPAPVETKPAPVEAKPAPVDVKPTPTEIDPRPTKPAPERPRPRVDRTPKPPKVDRVKQPVDKRKEPTKEPAKEPAKEPTKEPTKEPAKEPAPFDPNAALPPP